MIVRLDPKYVVGFVEGSLERIGEDDPEEEQILRDLWEGEKTQREVLIGSLKADWQVRRRRHADRLPRSPLLAELGG
jgi:hypothetical protein